MSTAGLVQRDGALWLRNVCCVPSIHGRVLFAREVRRLFLSRRFGAVAVELPPSLVPAILQATDALPHVTAVVHAEPGGEWCYVPADPCDSIIEAIRLARRERIPIELVDAEIADFRGHEIAMPDDYAVSRIGLVAYYAAVRVALPDTGPQGDLRERRMAAELRRLSAAHDSVLFVCGLAHLPGVVRHFREGTPAPDPDPPPFDIRIRSIHPDSLYFALGELPFTTGLYERHRASLTLDEFEKVDVFKELLLETREEHHRRHPDALDHVTPGDLKTLLQYARNLTLLDQRLTPSLYRLAVAAKGVAGNDFAIALIEAAKFYPYLDPTTPWPTLEMTPRRARFDGGVEPVKPRLPGLAKEWKRLRLEKRPGEEERRRWRTYWDPYRSCSWPPEDEIIEGFTGHVRRRTIQILAQSQRRTEEFVTSLKDGLDLRATLRDHHLGKIYVREEPVVRGRVGAVVFVFEEAHDDRRFPWRSTWQAEHQNESTLAFYATDFRENLVGPGIARAEYGGAMFVFPPIVIPDVWTDRRFDEARGAMERLVLAAVHYSRERYVAYVAARPPTAWMRSRARLRRRHLVYLPLSTFNPTTLRKLRRFHVLNGQEVRSWAARFIR